MAERDEFAELEAQSDRERLARTAGRIRDRFQWKRVVAPRPWNPRDVGEELVGYYGGRTLTNGKFGQYEIAIVHVGSGDARTISGVAIIQLLDASLIEKGHAVRVVWKGTKDLGEGHKLKCFELYKADYEAMTQDELPEVRQ